VKILDGRKFDMSKISRKIDGRPTPIHQVTTKNVDKEEWEPDEVTFSVIKDGRKYRVVFSCPIMGLDEWMSPFSSKMDAINFAENMAEAT
jgi:hypothetical protein|tara:strand:- start:2851 stop:3120 length:270 start_codon:yes stop_codon:yes gene_type:complete